MARIIAIDYGKVRVGLAVSDPLQLIANGLKTVGNAELFTFLHDYVKREQVEAMVVGLPKSLQNRDTDFTSEVNKFVRKLKKEFPAVEVHCVDERFTSKIAMDTILRSGVKKVKRKNKALIDEVSAIIILQSYLEQKENRN